MGDAVEFAVVVIEAAGQRQHGAVPRGQGHQAALNGWRLRQSPVAVGLLFHPDHIAGLEDVASPLERGGAPVFISVRTRPEQAVPVNVDGPHASDMRRHRLFSRRYDQGREQAADAGIIVQQLFPPLLIVPLVQRVIALRPPVAVPLVVFQQGLGHGAVGRRLVFVADRGGDDVALAVGFDAKGRRDIVPRHLGDVGGLQLDAGPVQRGCHWSVVGLEELGAVYVIQLEHAPQHIISAFHRPLLVAYRVRSGRGLGQSRQHGVLRQVQFGEGFAVIDLSGGVHAISALAQEDLVQVKFQDLLFAQLPFDLERQEDLVQFSDV